MRLNPRQIRAVGDYQVNYPYLTDMLVIGSDNIKYRVIESFQSTGNFESDKQYLQSEYAADLSLAAKITGFTDKSDSILDFNNSNRLFSITPTALQYCFWIKGIKRIKVTEENLVISNQEGRHIVYFDGDTLVDYTAGGAEPWMAYEVCVIAYIYWSVNQQQALVFTDNRHGVGMDWPTKTFLHLALGTTYINGLDFIDIHAHQDGSQDNHCQFGIEDGLIMNEDIITPIIHTLPQTLRNIAQIPILYQTGSNGDWVISETTDFPVIPFSEGQRLAYNQYTGTTYQLTEIANAKYLLISYYATNCQLHPIIGILGQKQYNNITNARKDAPLAALRINFLPLAEFVLLGTVIYQSKDAFNNTVKARIVTVDKTGGDYIDFKQMTLHNLAGIAQSAAAHFQYLTNAPTIDWDTSQGDFAEITLTDNRILGLPTNISAGTNYNLLVKQDAIGNRTLTFDELFFFPNSVAPVLSTNANAIDLLRFISDGEKLYFQGVEKGYGTV